MPKLGFNQISMGYFSTDDPNGIYGTEMDLKTFANMIFVKLCKAFFGTFCLSHNPSRHCIGLTFDANEKVKTFHIDILLQSDSFSLAIYT